MIKYEIFTSRHSSSATIRPIEVDRETESSIWVNGSRRAKRSSYENYYDTWDEAKEALLSDATNKANVARRSLQNAQGYLGNVKGLKNPI